MKNKNHHYVPRVYLKNFATQTNKEYYLNALSKSEGKIFSPNIKGVAQEHDFYKIDDLDNPQKWEEIYSQVVEPLLGELLTKIINRCNLNVLKDGTEILSVEEKMELSFLMLAQLERGKVARCKTEELYNKNLPVVLDNINKEFPNLTDEEKVVVEKFKTDYNKQKSVFMNGLLNPEHIANILPYIFMRRFQFLKINDDREFITSDEPVIFMNYKTLNVKPYTNGLKNSSTIVIYPITPKILLLCFHPKVYMELYSLIKKDYDRCLFNIIKNRSERFININNHKQIEHCYNYVYAKSKRVLKSYKAFI